MQDSPSSPQHAITVENLTKVFKSGFNHQTLTAVDQVSFHVKPGEVYGLIGPNGCGKSTTMKIMLGLLKPTSGRTLIFGVDSHQVQSRSQVGFLPENPYFYKHLTGRETLVFYAKLCGLRGQHLRQRVEEMLELTGLSYAAQRRVGGYSKGMLQRIGLAQALIQSPRLLILDEPTAGVDPVGSRKIRDLILNLKSQGITILVTSHLLEQMQEVCDRVGIMSNGVMVKEGKLEELIAVETQTNVLLENAPPELLEDIKHLIAQKYSQTQLLSATHPKTTLEKLFIDTTLQTGEHKSS